MERFVNYYKKGENLFDTYIGIFAYYLTIVSTSIYFGRELLNSDKPMIDIISGFVGCLILCYGLGILLYFIVRKLFRLLNSIDSKCTIVNVFSLGIILFSIGFFTISGLSLKSVLNEDSKLIFTAMVISIAVGIYTVIVTSIYIYEVAVSYNCVTKGEFNDCDDLYSISIIGQLCQLDIDDKSLRLRPTKMVLTSTSVMLKDHNCKWVIDDNNVAKVYFKDNKSKWSKAEESFDWAIEIFAERMDYLYGEFN